MSNTPRLSIPEISESQASKYVTHNSALRDVDALLQCTVADKDLTSPPGGESDGDAYIVGSGASGDWSGHDNDIAYYESSAYDYHTPEEGWIVYVQDENKLYVFNGSSWVEYPSLISVADLSDVPAMSGNGYKLIRVNAGQTAYEYVQWVQDFAIWKPGQPSASEVIWLMGMVRDVRFGDDFYWSEGHCVTAPTDSAGHEFIVQVDGVEVGQITFASGANSATFSTDSGQLNVARGEVIKIISQASPDPAIEDIGINLRALIV
jgi:hypothetical protein